MRIKIEYQIEQALSQICPIEALRNLVLDLNKNGIKKEDILSEFYQFDEYLRKEERDNDVDILEDVIDMMTGYYTGRNLDLS